MKYNLSIIALLVTAGGLNTISTAAFAQTVEESAEACSEAARLIREDKLEEALDEANWCLEGLKQLKQAQTLAVLPDSVSGFVGGDVSNNSVLGMTAIERTYELGADRIQVSMMSVAGDSGGFAALAALGMSLGSTGKKHRIQKRTVIDNSGNNGQAEFLVQLKSGGMINVSSKTVKPEAVLDFVRAFPIEEIDIALGR